jgi:beta-lactamase regulating signal transducer with metallopeptidase domain
MTPIVLSRAALLLDATWANLWQASWQGGLIVLAVWIMLRLFRSMPARWQCWCWRLAMAKFVVVLCLPSLVNLPLLPAPPVVMTRTAPSLPMVKARPIPVSRELPAMPVRMPTTFSPRVLWHYGWLIGLGVFGVCMFLSWLKAAGLRRRGQPIADGPIREQLDAQTRLFRLRRSPQLLEIPGSGSPMLLGIVRPALLLPSETRRQLTDAEQTMVFGHELAHICRLDLLWGLLASLVRSLFFFHPLVWLAERQIKLAQEIADDELAVRQQNSDPIGYGNLLVSVVGKLGPRIGFRPLVSTVSLETAGPVHSLTRRLVAMSRIGQAPRRVLVGSVVVLLLLVMVGLVPWRLVAAEAKAPASKAETATTTVLSQPTAPSTDNVADQAHTKDQPSYRATVQINEKKKGRADRQLLAPAIAYPAGQSAMVASNHRLRGKDCRLIILVGTPSKEQPVEHVMQVLKVHNELPPEEESRIIKNAGSRLLERDSQHPPLSCPSGSTFTFTGSSTTSNCPGSGSTCPASGMKFSLSGGPGRLISDVSESNNGVATKSPKIMFGNDTTGTISFTYGDDEELEISATVSPADKPVGTMTEYEAMLKSQGTVCVGDYAVFVDTADGRQEFSADSGVWTAVSARTDEEAKQSTGSSKDAPTAATSTAQGATGFASAVSMPETR